MSSTHATPLTGPQTTPQTTDEVRTPRIVIIGGGFSGLGMAIRLRAMGIDDFVILERAASHGGTWRDNSYPGCACDVQSVLYSFSFAPNPDWSHSFSPQDEIWAYLRRCATEYDIDRHFVFGETVTAATWDDERQQWNVQSTSGNWRPEIVIMATGGLSDAVMPRIEGLSTFAGAMFHSAQWRHDVDLTGKRVAVIGTGASAIQFVPRIQPRVAQLDVFQRTPPWIMPRRDKAIGGWRRQLYRHVPALQRAHRAATYLLREALHLPFRNARAARVVEWVAGRHMHVQVADPALRTKLQPHYRIGCKRILVSDDYYPALAQPNVALVTDAIISIEAAGVRTADGVLHAADVIIFGTGFRPTDPVLAPHIRGRTGETLAETWQGSPRAYMGTSHAGFPNLFTLMGPNTALGHSSVVLMAEAQVEHVIGVLRYTEQGGFAAAEPDAIAQRDWVAGVDARLRATTWNAGGCSSWYIDATGRNSTLWPDGVGRFRRTVARINPGEYRWIPRREARAPELVNA